MRRVAVTTVLSVTVLASGCAAEPGTGSPSDAASESHEARTSIAPIDGVPAELLEAIVSDGAQRAGVEPDDVTILAAESVTWSDGSLGCPEPGMMYTQALVPGYRVVVRAGGEDLNFHAAQSGDFRFCENPRPPAERNGNE